MAEREEAAEELRSEQEEMKSREDESLEKTTKDLQSAEKKLQSVQKSAQESQVQQNVRTDYDQGATKMDTDDDDTGSSSLVRDPIVDFNKTKISQTTPETQQWRSIFPLFSRPSAGKERPERYINLAKLNNPSAEDGTVLKVVHGDIEAIDGSFLSVSSNSFALQVLTNLQTCFAQQEADIGREFIEAAKYFLTERQFFLQNDNETYFTGIFCNALNSVLPNGIDGGIAINHQECIGEKSTHSDICGRMCRSTTPWPVLMIGEGKRDEKSGVREETRGQIMNELVRHRNIDRARADNIPSSKNSFAASPILLLAFNVGFISLELAFPCTKDGSMEANKWVRFGKEVSEKTETFWTLPIAFCHWKSFTIYGMAKLLQFIRETLERIHNFGGVRFQHKTPWVTQPDWYEGPEEVLCQRHGSNVTVFAGKGLFKVYKEFCYYMRSSNRQVELGINTVTNPISAVDDEDMRRPPPRGLLDVLGDPYTDWEVEDGPFGIKILSYDYIHGAHVPSTVGEWISLLKRIKCMHDTDWIHSDLLPRNLLFADGQGYPIDFDLSRKGNNNKYVKGFDYNSFSCFRHSDAQAGNVMSKDHDVHSLCRISECLFENCNLGDCKNIDDLITVFEGSQPPTLKLMQNPPDMSNPVFAMVSKRAEEMATGSPCGSRIK